MKEIPVSFKSEGQKVSGVLHLPDKPTSKTIIICTGFQSKKEGYAFLARDFCKNGFQALRFDFRGRGESKGDMLKMTFTDSINDLLSAIKFVKGKIGIFGSSYGALVALHTTIREKRIKALVFRSPVTDYKIVYRGKLIKYLSKKDVLKYKKNLYTKALVDDALKYNSFEAVKKLRCPILIVHGKKDATVPIEGSIKLYRNAKVAKRLIVLEKGVHWKIQLMPKIVVKESLSWFKKWLK